ncbi:hypothetical protein R3P38DRAFT_3293199 [Favolaschia claudopus]|uniref:Uncharacterized protein n=1 Tax=Favolaschia claudopus TaxID=2862362 RepID=A0AAV9ZI08_9AGAR
MFFIYLGACLPSPHPPMLLAVCVRHSYAFRRTLFVTSLDGHPLLACEEYPQLAYGALTHVGAHPSSSPRATLPSSSHTLMRPHLTSRLSVSPRAMTSTSPCATSPSSSHTLTRPHLTSRLPVLPRAMTSTPPCATAPSSSLTRRRPPPPSRDGVLILTFAIRHILHVCNSSFLATCHIASALHYPDVPSSGTLRDYAPQSCPHMTRRCLVSSSPGLLGVDATTCFDVASLMFIPLASPPAMARLERVHAPFASFLISIDNVEKRFCVRRLAHSFSSIISCGSATPRTAVFPSSLSFPDAPCH